MNRFINFLALSLMGICPIFAQESESQPLLRCLPGYPSYVFGENVNLRLDSSTTAKVVAQLNVGEKVIVLGRSLGTLTLNGRTEHWYRVSALNQQKEGYVWGGLLSCAVVEGTDVLFLMNKIKVPNTNLMTVEIRAVAENKVLHAIANPDFPYYTSGLGEFFLSGHISDNRGLPNFKNVVCFSSNLETGMCDVIGTNTLWHLLWDGKTMTPLPLVEAALGEDCMFGSYGGASYIFPSDPEGKPDLVLHRSIEGECDEEDGIEYTKTICVRKLVWDGKGFIFPEKK